jgi:hypothetical protein
LRVGDDGDGDRTSESGINILMGSAGDPRAVKWWPTVTLIAVIVGIFIPSRMQKLINNAK